MSVCFITTVHSADVRFIECVDVLMFFPIGAIRKTPIAELALEWPFSKQMEQDVPVCVEKKKEGTYPV
jgi:hypothetical protein